MAMEYKGVKTVYFSEEKSDCSFENYDDFSRG